MLENIDFNHVEQMNIELQSIITSFPKLFRFNHYYLPLSFYYTFEAIRIAWRW